MPTRLSYKQYRAFRRPPSKKNLFQEAGIAKDKPLIPTEDDECYQLVWHLDRLMEEGKVVQYTHIPNETYTPYHSVRTKNRMMGVRGGFPDYVIVTPSKVIYIEMKRIKQSNTSDLQKTWHAALRATGAVVEVCKGFVQAKELLEREGLKLDY